MRAMSLRTIRKYEPEMRRLGVSKVARSPRGFLTAYKRARGKLSRLTPYWRRRDVLMMAEQYAKIGAPVLISIYEGNKSGIGATPHGRLDDWQNNLRTQAYEHEIASVFGGVFRSGKIFLARARE